MTESAAYARRGYLGGAKQSTVPAGISDVASSLTGADLSTWAGVASNGPFMFVLDPGLSTEEVCEATGLSGNNITGITRGRRNTTGVTHSANCVIKHVSTDRDFDEANRLVNAILGISGLAAGDLLEVLTATTFARVPKGTAGQLLGMNDAATGHSHFSTAPLATWKQAVRVATTANGTLATAYANGQTVDGVTLATGDRILLKNQTTGAENGIYTVAAAGAPTRATDFDTAGKAIPGSTTMVREGTANTGTMWRLSNTGTVTPGSTAMTFAQTAGGVATDTIWDTKGDLAVASGADAASKLAAGSDFQHLRARAAATLGIEYATLATADGPIGSGVNESTTSTSYTTLATAGPAVTVTTGTAALVILTGGILPALSAGAFALMGFSVSGATTVAASDAYSIFLENPVTSALSMQSSGVFLVTGLTPGSNVFTAKYRTTTGTANFQTRSLIVIPI